MGHMGHMNIARRYGITGPKRNTPEKGGDRRILRKKASGAPPAGDDVSRETNPRAGTSEGRRLKATEAALVATSKLERSAPAGSELVPGRKVVPPPLEVPDDILRVEQREPASPVGQAKMGKPRLVQFTVMQEIGVEEFRRAAGLRSTSEAIRALIEKGLGK